MRRPLLFLALAGAIAAPVAVAQEATTKQEIIEGSAPICRDALEAIQPHIRRMNRAEENGRVRKFIRHGRRLVRTARPYVRELDELSPQSDGRTRYRRFVNNTFSTLDQLDAALDALADGRGRVAERRAENSVEHARTAKRAARRYGLRDSCIAFVS